MLKVQVDYWTLKEAQRHNLQTERQAQNELAETFRHRQQEEATGWFNAYEAQRTHKVNEAINQSQADSARIKALADRDKGKASLISARANETNAETNRINAAINARNADSNALQAAAALRNAAVNEGNLKVNQVNAMVNAGSTAVDTTLKVATTPGKVKGQRLSNSYGSLRTTQVANNLKKIGGK